MKSLIISVLLLAFSSVIFGQKITCESFREGLFKIESKEYGLTSIERTKSYQIEENIAMGYKVLFDITWVDDCTYELRPKKVIKGDISILGDGTNVLRTRIKQLTEKGYISENSSNFFEGVLDFEVERLN